MERDICETVNAKVKICMAYNKADDVFTSRDLQVNDEFINIFRFTVTLGCSICGKDYENVISTYISLVYDHFERYIFRFVLILHSDSIFLKKIKLESSSVFTINSKIYRRHVWYT